MGAWDSDDNFVGKRRLRPKRRRGERSRARIVVPLVLILLLGGAGAYWWFTRPTGLAALPDPAVVAPGGFRASIGDDGTITVGLEVRNVTSSALTLVSARILAPPGLTPRGLSLLIPGPENEGFALTGELPDISPVRLGTADQERNAVVAARFAVDCSTVRGSSAPVDEQIFVTIAIGTQQREEEVTPPVVGDLPWLTATAQRACLDPVPTDSPEPPLPTDTPTPGPGG
ncbi:MAG: hypothetical protein ACM30G_00720 [Micromonosporaceae bacterium]